MTQKIYCGFVGPTALVRYPDGNGGMQGAIILHCNDKKLRSFDVHGNLLAISDVNTPCEGAISVTELKTIAIPARIPQDGNVAVADFNMDGQLDVLVVSDGTPYSTMDTAYIYAYDPVSEDILFIHGHYAKTISYPMIGDVNGDGNLEFVYMDYLEPVSLSRIRAMTYNAANGLQTLWQATHGDESGQTSMTLFDFNQDGIMEIVFRDNANLRIINGSGTSHLTGNDTVSFYNLYTKSMSAGTWKEYPVVRRPFNNFLQQATTLDQYGRPFMPLANASATNDTSVTHENGVVSLNFTFCNTGGEPLTPPFYLIYYANSYGETYLGQTVFTGEWPPLLPGECMTVHRNFTEDELGIVEDLQTIVAVINADMMGVAQYGGSQLQFECDTSDNYFYFNVDFCDIPQDTVIADICVRESYSDENFDIPATETQVAGTFYYSRVFQVDNCDSVIVLKLWVLTCIILVFSENLF